ncbi:MAG: hypothetical protein IIA89_14715 [Chloroflexi bacterium]|nr:hypothetical protein [Chloroflexota bacterium]
MPNPDSDFHREMLNTYEQAKTECKYTANRFMQMVAELGGVATAKRLLATSTPSDGFTTLWECERLYLTVEFAVLKKEFASLFSDDERATAKQRLLDYRFNLSKYEDILLI